MRRGPPVGPNISRSDAYHPELTPRRNPFQTRIEVLKLLPKSCRSCRRQRGCRWVESIEFTLSVDGDRPPPVRNRSLGDAYRSGVRVGRRSETGQLVDGREGWVKSICIGWGYGGGSGWWKRDGMDQGEGLGRLRERDGIDKGGTVGVDG